MGGKAAGFEIDPARSPGFTAHMRLLLAIGLGAWLVGGCQTSQSDFSTEPTLSGNTAGPAESQPDSETFPLRQKLLVNPDANLLVGTVSVFNAQGRFVVLDFPVGKMPAAEQVLFVYRRGLKIGEVRVTGPERDHKTVADLISGEAQKGDEVCNQ
jgi:hypothetical protein